MLYLLKFWIFTGTDISRRNKNLEKDQAKIDISNERHQKLSMTIKFYLIYTHNKATGVYKGM